MPTPETLKQLHIVIAGAGPAGLATARLLHLNGIGVTVLERDADRSARTQGGSLDLGEDGGLRVLAAAPGEVVPRQALGGTGAGANERAVDVQVNRLRRKIEQDPANPLFVQTVRGVGYRLVVSP